MAEGPAAEQRRTLGARPPASAAAPCRLLLFAAEARLGPSNPDSAYVVLKLKDRSYVSAPARPDPEDAGLYRWPPPPLEVTLRPGSAAASEGASEDPGQDEPLRVEVLGARGLRGTHAPTCTCELAGKPESRFETGPGDDAIQPVWDHEADVPDYESGDELTFAVYDRDSDEQEKLLGRAALGGERLREGFDGEVPLTDTLDGDEAYLDLKVSPARRQPATPAPAPAAEVPPAPAPRPQPQAAAGGLMAELAFEGPGPPTNQMLKVFLFATGASGTRFSEGEADGAGVDDGRGLGFFEVPLWKLKDAGKPRTVVSGPFVPYGGRVARGFSSRCSLALRAAWEPCGGALEGCTALREETRELCAMLDGLAVMAGAPLTPSPSSNALGAGSPQEMSRLSLLHGDAASSQLTLCELAAGAEQMLSSPSPSSASRPGGVRGYGRRAVGASAEAAAAGGGVHSPAQRPWRLDLARGIGRGASDADAAAGSRRGPGDEAHRLKVKVVAARGLCNAIGMLDPYGSLDFLCACEVLGKPSSRFRTPAVGDRLDPVWNQECELADYAPGDTLAFTIYGTSHGRSQQVIAGATLRADELNADGGFAGEVALAQSGRGIDAFLKVRVRPPGGANPAAPPSPASPAAASAAAEATPAQPPEVRHAAEEAPAQQQQRSACQERPAPQRPQSQPKRAPPPPQPQRPAAHPQRPAAAKKQAPSQRSPSQPQRRAPAACGGGGGRRPPSTEGLPDEVSRFLRERRHLHSEPELEARLAEWLAPSSSRRSARPATAPAARAPAAARAASAGAAASAPEEAAAEERLRRAARRRYPSLRAAFGAFDADGDGLVSFPEFQRGVAQLGLAAPPGAEMLECLWRRADGGNLGYLSIGRLGEFLGILR